MSLNSIQTNNTRTCPHGFPIGACPICNGMGGGVKKADFSAKPGEMSWNQCAAIGAFLKAQKQAKEAREQDAVNFAQNARAFQNALMNSSQRLANIAAFFTQNTPSIISKPANFVLNTLVGGTIRTIANAPAAIMNTIQTIHQKVFDISDKLTAIIGEFKAAIEKKISEGIKDFKKKVKYLFSIFQPIEGTEHKKTFKLKTFIHDLYKKITGGNNDN